MEFLFRLYWFVRHVHESGFPSKRSGFTLVELLVVVGLLGIITSVAVFLINPQEQFKRANDGLRKSDLISLQSSLELYRGDNTYYPPSLSDLTSGSTQYIRVLPTDPTGYSYTYVPEPVGCNNEFTFCSGYRLFACLESYDKNSDVNRNPSESNECEEPLTSYSVYNP